MDFTAALIVLATFTIGCGVSQDSSPASTVISSPETSAPSLTASTVTSSPSIASSLILPPTTSSPVTPPRVTTTWSQVTSSTQRNSLTFMTSKGVPSGSDVTTRGELDVANVLSVPGGDLTTALPVWIKCTTDVQLEDLGNDNIVKVLSAWCENYQKIIDCMSRDIVTSAPDNPLDFFLNLTFNNNTLRIKSENVCAKFKERKTNCHAQTRLMKL
uniref:Uncharacterized protein n=1 Tax=Arion vulgaris TaxID=1028688 RepID=A0A0B7AWK9_9EUPU